MEITRLAALPGQLERRGQRRPWNDRRGGKAGEDGDVYQPARRTLAADGLRYGRV
ncbi:hypothetical protein [Erwinia amylovora]|uniref:hypothetical protein n=1 Tax=Erwinia amylovora TaxID=552 RepID=UPI003CFEEB82